MWPKSFPYYQYFAYTIHLATAVCRIVHLAPVHLYLTQQVTGIEIRFKFALHFYRTYSMAYIAILRLFSWREHTQSARLDAILKLTNNIGIF